MSERLVNTGITPGIALEVILQSFEKNKIKQKEDFPDNDMLLFEYGSYDWDAKGEKFELNFARQIADPNDNEFFQLSLTLYYHPNDFSSVKAFNLWSIDKPTINQWKAAVANSEGFIKAELMNPIDFKTELNKT